LYLLTYLLTPWSTVPLGKLTGSQLVKKFPIFFATRRFIAAFTSARHLSLSYARSIQSMPPKSHFLKIHFNIVLPSTPGSSKWSLSLRFPHHNLVYTSPLLRTCYMSRPAHSSRFNYPNNVRRGVRSFSSSLRSFLQALLPRPLRPKYSPQHPILKYPQPTFLPQCERPSFTPIQNNCLKL
jgi:hypothetical protein